MTQQQFPTPDQIVGEVYEYLSSAKERISTAIEMIEKEKVKPTKLQEILQAIEGLDFWKAWPNATPIMVNDTEEKLWILYTKINNQVTSGYSGSVLEVPGHLMMAAGAIQIARAKMLKLKQLGIVSVTLTPFQRGVEGPLAPIRN